METIITDKHTWLEKSDNNVDEWISNQNNRTFAYVNSRYESVKDYFLNELETVRDKVYKKDEIRRYKTKDRTYIFDTEDIDDKDQIFKVLPSPEGRYVAVITLNTAKENYKIILFKVEREKLTCLKTEFLGERQAELVWVSDDSGFYYIANFRSIKTDRLVFCTINNDVTSNELIFSHDLYLGIPRLTDLDCVYDKLIFYHHDGKSVDLYGVYNEDHLNVHKITCTKNNFAFPLVTKENTYLISDVESDNKEIFKLDVDNDKIEKIVKECGIELRYAHIVDKYFFAVYEDKCASFLKVYDMKGNHINDVPIPEYCLIKSVAVKDVNKAKIEIETFYSPSITYEYDVIKDNLILKENVLDDLDISKIEVTLEYTPDSNGIKIPYIKLFQSDSNPTVLYGYGGFNFVVKPNFRPEFYLCLKLGINIVLGITRGNGGWGKKWYQSGIKENKANVIDDFINIASDLHERGYTSKDKLGIYGGSAGGITIAGALNKKPEMFKCALCINPLLDMMNYERLGGNYIHEYGSVEDETMRDYILSYSPFNNINPQGEYPATLFVGSGKDIRVNPAHPRKMVAKLQNEYEKENVFYYEFKNLGHLNKNQTDEEISATALSWGFFIGELTGRTK